MMFADEIETMGSNRDAYSQPRRLPVFSAEEFLPDILGTGLNSCDWLCACHEKKFFEMVRLSA
jgi:hypothetical protein